jgi:hypothetical protein
MPRMSGSDGDPRVTAAFKAALLHQGLIALLVLAVLVAAWAFLPAFRSALRSSGLTGLDRAEPAGRRVLRIGFGLLWLFDGILQAQPNMAGGMPSGAIEPVAGVSSPWVQHVTHWAQVLWVDHPVSAGSSAVWIQIGIGLWLLVAPAGLISRLAGLASVGWGLIVWVFGEVFGGIFAPGLTWLNGAPGSVLVYVVAGAPDCAALSRLALTAAGPAQPGRAGGVPGRDGWSPGPAEPGVLAGSLVRSAPDRWRRW